MKSVIAYKLARPDGFDFYTGKTINYRGNIGEVVYCPSPDAKLGVCSRGVIHASKNPNDCFIGAKIPCSAYRVKGKPECGNAEKWGFTELSILEEIFDLDKLFGWKYSEVKNPLNPLRRKVKPSKNDISSLKDWDSVGDSVWASVRDCVRDSVWDSVWASVRDSVRDSVGDSVWDSVRDSVGDSVWDSVRDSVRASVRDSVGDSVWDSVGAYFGSLFPNIQNWKYITHKPGEYPYQCLVELWKRGLVPSFDGKLWRLHSGKNAGVVFEINKDDLKEC